MKRTAKTRTHRIEEACNIKARALEQYFAKVLLHLSGAIPFHPVASYGLVTPRRLHAVTGVRVEVRDSGPGLAPNAVEQLFGAFCTTMTTGLGSGLSICRSIVEAHGSLLTAGNNVPRGTIFQFTLNARTESGV